MQQCDTVKQQDKILHLTFLSTYTCNLKMKYSVCDYLILMIQIFVNNCLILTA